MNRAFSYQRRNASCQSLLLRSLLLLVSSAVASPVAVADHLEQLDEFVVIGRFPGPPLWKVSRNGNVLWILPLIDAYPKKMEWDSARVEALIAQSQEYIERPLAYRGLAAAKPITMIRISRLSKRSRTLPDGQQLQDVLSPELYWRFRSLKDNYLSRDREIETLRVSAAGSRLQQEILAQENLETLRYNRGDSPEVITSRLGKWMKRNNAMRRTSTSYGSILEVSSRDLKLAEEAMEEASTISAFASWEVACLEKTIAYFEKDIGLVKKRANAWARGHADDLLDPTPLNGQGDACNDPPALPEDSPAMAKLREEAPGLAALLLNDRSEAERTSRDRWLAAAEVALANNATTFSALYIGDILDTDGPIARLAAKGYVVSISAE